MAHWLYTGDESSVYEIADFSNAGQYIRASQYILICWTHDLSGIQSSPCPGAAECLEECKSE